MKNLLVALVMASASSHAAIPVDAVVVPNIEFNCKGLRGVVLWSNGNLEINGKTFEMRYGPGSATINFDNKVSITGERDGDDLYLGNVVIKYEGKNYQCRAE